jgi:hypothetical protein
MGWLLKFLADLLITDDSMAGGVHKIPQKPFTMLTA